MGQVINTNSLSLLTQNNLNKSQGALNTSIERLSSGMRINSAKDDAAGQAIANRFTANIKGLTQAQRNANDGISLAQTTEGALNEINTNLQRIRELTVQSANGSNSAEDKASIQDEITQRLKEIDRTSAQTDFNGVKVLAADNALKIQVGANDGETIDIDLKKIDSAALSLSGFSVAGNSGNALNVSGNYSTVGAPPKTTNLTAAATALTTATGKTVNADELSLKNVLDASNAPTTKWVVSYAGENYAASVIPTSGVVALNVVDIDFTDTANGITTAVALDNQLVKVGTASGGAVTGFVTVQGKNYSLASAQTALTDTGAAASDTASAAGTDIVLSGTGATAEFAGAATGNALAKLDAALKTVDVLRGSLGAVQNRFDSIISNLGTTVTNLSASRSRIEDADYATEVSNMTRAQILQQAGTSVLAKANSSTEGVMSLLR